MNVPDGLPVSLTETARVVPVEGPMPEPIPDPGTVVEEFALHDVMANIFQGLADKYGTRVLNVTVSWNDMKIDRIDIPMTKRFP